MESDYYYLELSETPVRFESVNQLTNVFFDDSNKHVFAVRSGGVMGVVVKGPTAADTLLNFRMEDRGPVLSIKFSLDRKVLAVQRTNTSVEFMNFDGTKIDVEYAQTCKKNANILGFVWSQRNEVAFMTDHGIELYMVIPEKRAVKHLKTTSAACQWFVWCSANKIALLASAHGSQLQPVVFRPGAVHKLPRVETEPGRMALERDVTLSTLYGVPAVLILRHQSGPQSAEVHVHTMSGPAQTPLKTHVLKLGLSGRFAINIVDDLILVHHQASRSSQIFDVALPGESDGNVKYHTSVAPARSFKQAMITLPGLVEAQSHVCELYSTNWVVFQPNIVIDAKLGCLWHINLGLPELCKSISDLAVCTQVALNRTNAKAILLEILLEAVTRERPALAQIQASFNHINLVYRDYIEAELQQQTASPPNAPYPAKSQQTPAARVHIDQMDVYTELFRKIDADTALDKLEWTLICYLTSLVEHGIPAQHNTNELTITTLVKRKKFAGLQQLIQYGVISDSKPIACLLLSLGNLHAAATQMALDMLARLGAIEEMQEILLSGGEVLAALRLGLENANPRKFLQAAQGSGDAALFHSVVEHFRNNAQFAGAFQKDERLRNYLAEYNMMFSNGSA